MSTIVQQDKLWAHNFKSILQISFHLKDFAYSIMRSRPRFAAWAREFQTAVYSIEVSKGAINKAYFHDLTTALPNKSEFWHNLKSSKNVLVEILSLIHSNLEEISESKCLCPVCECFLSENCRNIEQIFNEKSTKKWIKSQGNEKLITNPDTINLILRINEYSHSDFAWIFEFAKNNKHLYTEEAEYQLVGIIFKQKDYPRYITVIYVKKKGEWVIIQEEKETFTLQFIELGFNPEYLFFEKLPNPKLLDNAMSFFDGIFTNLFYIDEFFTCLAKAEDSISWKKVFIDEFNRIENSKNEDRQLVINCSKISKSFLKISKTIKCTVLNYKTLFVEFLDANHPWKGMKACDCSICLSFLITNSRPNEVSFSRLFLTIKIKDEINAENFFSRLGEYNEFILGRELRFSDYLIILIKKSTGTQALRNITGILYSTSSAKSSLEFSLVGVFYFARAPGKYRSLCKNEEQNNWRIIEFKQATEQVCELVAEYDTIDKALCEMQDWVPFLLIYTKVFILERKKGNASASVPGTVPLRLDNSENENLCYINSAIQALFNIYSFKIDLIDWDCTKAWAKTIKEIFKSSIQGNPQGKKIYKLSDFRKEYKLDTGFDGTQKEKSKGVACVFLLHFLKAIHTNSRWCRNNKLCPSCKNFNIEGRFFWRESNGQAKDKVLPSKFNLIQVLSKFPVNLHDSVLTTSETTEYSYRLNNPPPILFINLQGYVISDVVQAEWIAQYLQDNERIEYKTETRTYTYQLKSIILYGDRHYKSLLFSRYCQKWMLINDYIIEPLYLRLQDYEIKKLSHVPDGLLYTIVFDDSLVSCYITSLLICFSGLKMFAKGVGEWEVQDKRQASFKKTVERIGEWVRLGSASKFEEIKKKNISTFRMYGEIRSIQDFVSILLKIVHEREGGDDQIAGDREEGKGNLEEQAEPTSNCLFCKLFFCTRCENRDKPRNEFLNLSFDKIGDQYDISTHRFTMQPIENSDKRSKDLEINKRKSKKQLDNIETSASIPENDRIKLPEVLVIKITNESSEEIKRFQQFLKDNTELRGVINENEAYIYEMRAIFMKSIQGYDSLSILCDHPPKWRVYRNQQFLQETIDLTEFEADFIPYYLFYSKLRPHLLVSALRILNGFEAFRQEVIQIVKPVQHWIVKLISIFEDIRRVENIEEILEFIKIFDDNYCQKLCFSERETYDIEHVISLIISRVHRESLCEFECPSCKNFLKKGAVMKKGSGELVVLFGIAITNFLDIRHPSLLEGNVLSHVIEDNELIEIEYFMPDPPPILYYCLYWNNNSQEDRVLRMFAEYLGNNGKITYFYRDIPHYYKLQSVVFQKIMSDKDKFYYATVVRDQNQNEGWEIYSQKNCIYEESVVEFMYQREKKLKYFPAVLMYTKQIL